MLGPGWHTAEGIPTGQVSLAHWPESQAMSDWERACRRKGTGSIPQGARKKGSRYKSSGGKLWLSDISSSILLPAYAFCLGMLLRNDKRLYSQDNTYKLVLHSGEHLLQCFLPLWSCSATDHLYSNLKFKLNVFGWNIPLRMWWELWPLSPEKYTYACKKFYIQFQGSHCKPIHRSPRDQGLQLRIPTSLSPRSFSLRYEKTNPAFYTAASQHVV